ncbi:trypsin-1-like [Anabrus simplex]|uniref:trypsin-1-like n=1 Tax=Anabrus simplex TaxID=316456 RepID=UPI0035A30697
MRTWERARTVTRAEICDLSDGLSNLKLEELLQLPRSVRSESDKSGDWPQVTLRGGSSYVYKGGIVRNVTEIVSHDYPPNDITLLKVDEPWPLNGNTISLARLPRQDDPIPEGSPATVMGWGGTDGDSGGPVLVNGEVVGIVSWGAEFGYMPNVHTRVSSYIDWIEKHVGSLPSAE